jgi:microcystin-dependent protein
VADPFVAEIRIFAGNFAPRGWAFCNGQLLPLAQNTALFSLLGTTYGGDGQSNFALPNLQDRFPMHPGVGSGLSPRDLGEQGGSAAVTLLPSEIPSHSHALRAVNAGDTGTPSATVIPAAPTGGELVYGVSSDPVPMAGETLGPAGSNVPHPNRQPYLALSFIIALQGVFPPRS